MNPHYQVIWDTVLQIPPGRVASYGQVAEEAGLPRRHRLVGKALRELPVDSGIPWYRVMNAQGRISLPPRSESAILQRELLEEEGVEFRGGRVDLRRFGWLPGS